MVEQIVPVQGSGLNRAISGITPFPGSLFPLFITSSVEMDQEIIPATHQRCDAESVSFAVAAGTTTRKPILPPR